MGMYKKNKEVVSIPGSLSFSWFKCKWLKFSFLKEVINQS
jgi:hypothetical protein